MNQSYSSVVNPLRKSLNIELYNETWFDKPPRTSKPLFDYDHPTLFFPEFPLSPFPSVSDLHDTLETPCVPSLLEKFPDTYILSSPFSTSNGLFFIRYTPEDTFKQRWFPVQINYDETTLVKMKLESTGDYHVNFLKKYDTLMTNICAMIPLDGCRNDMSIKSIATTLPYMELAHSFRLSEN